MVETQIFDFKDDKIKFYIDNNETWVSVRDILENLNLSPSQCKRQLSIFIKDEYLSIKTKTYFIKGKKELFINKKDILLLLSEVKITAYMNKNIVEKLNLYKEKFYSELDKILNANEKSNISKEIYKLKNEVEDLKKVVSDTTARFNNLVLDLTINTNQQQQLFNVAKDRIVLLLGDINSEGYKSKSRSYFSNLWNEFKKKFELVSYRDLSPFSFYAAKEFICSWELENIKL